MSKFIFQCTLSTPACKPLYKTFRGIGPTYMDLLSDILANVALMLSYGIHITTYETPTLDDIMRCWVCNDELVYTIHCEDSQYNAEFRLTPKYT